MADETLIMTFERFYGKVTCNLAGITDYSEGGCNLYIIRKRNLVLYIGIARSGIWERWFSRNGHMSRIQAKSGTWEGSFFKGFSPIGRVIQNNYPNSMAWTVELRKIPVAELETEEEKLIQEMRPLFNSIYRPDFTYWENKMVLLLEGDVIL